MLLPPFSKDMEYSNGKTNNWLQNRNLQMCLKVCQEQMNIFFTPVHLPPVQSKNSWKYKWEQFGVLACPAMPTACQGCCGTLHGNRVKKEKKVTEVPRWLLSTPSIVLKNTQQQIFSKKQRNANDKNLGGAKMEEEKTIFLFCSKSPHPHWAVHWVADSKSLVVHLFEAKKRCSLDSTCSEDFVSAAWKMYLINLQNVFVSIANIFFCFQNMIYK